MELVAKYPAILLLVECVFDFILKQSKPDVVEDYHGRARSPDSAGRDSQSPGTALFAQAAS